MLLPQREELHRIIHDVRRRWRWRVVARSLTVVAGAGAATVAVAACGLEALRFSPGAILTARAVTGVVFLALGWAFFVRPLARRVTDQQVALYLEEHEPSLQAALVSAVDAGSPRWAPRRTGESVALLTRLVEAAIEACQQDDLARRLERQSLRRSLLAFVTLVFAAAALFGAGPAFLRHGALAVLVPTTGVEAASPYSIDVSPGDATVARGADVSVAARLGGFTSADVDLFTRTSPGAPFERAPMTFVPPGPTPEQGAAPTFELTLFALRESVEYFVQSAGVRSRVFTLKAADLPYVERLQLEYVFPAYTGLEPTVVEQGGDIAVLRGSTVRLRVRSTLPAGAGRVVRDAKTQVPLARHDDGTFTGAFAVESDGLYRIELAAADGSFAAASPQYTIDALADEPPAVTFSKPARDLRATSIDELYVEAAADDDYGVARLDLVYAVNGGPEQQIPLAGPGRRPLRSMTAGHTFFLEELHLAPGDVVSYYARGSDNDAVAGAKTATSDIFFVQIQPFRKDYRAAESQAGGQMPPGGREGASDPSALSEQQRRIVSATFNLARDRSTVGAEAFRQDVVLLALAQGQLRERASALAGQILSRVAEADPSMRAVAASLTDAATAMSTAEQRLQARDPKTAIPPEQQALAHLQRAEESYRDVRVRMEQRGGGGGGGGQSASAAADELADLFQLELDKLRNQYETFERSRQQTADTKVDEVLERLKELARRQEQEAERQRQMAGNRQSAGGASAARQRQLADETEEAARQLERLSREEGRRDLEATARGLRQAAEAMRRAAAGGDAGAFAQARDAAEQLGQARDRLDRERSGRIAQGIDDALSRVRRMGRTQDGIQRDVADLPASGAPRREQLQRVFERKDALAAEAADIERQLDKTASEIRRERQQAARMVQEAADAMRDTRLKEKIRYSKGVAQNAPPETAAGFENQIGADISAVAERLQAAAGAAAGPERDLRGEALDRARALVRGLESLDQRLRDGNPDSTGGQDASGGGARRPDASPRQWQREAAQRRGDAEALRRDVRALGLDAGDLDSLIGRLRGLEDERAWDGPAGTAALRGQLVQGFRRFEFDLRRQLGAETAEQLLLLNSDDAPAAYRKAIEEYYRALARDRRQ